MGSVTLSPMELLQAAMVGVSRNIKSVGAAPSHGGKSSKDGWSDHCDGALGEEALAKFLNLYWSSSVNTFRSEADVGKIEVRTNSRRDGDLIMRPRDKFDETRYVLVISADMPVFRIAGWIYGREALSDESWYRFGARDRPKSYFVPQSALRPMADF